MRSLALIVAVLMFALASDARAQGVGEIDLYRPTESAEDGFGVGRPTDMGHLRFGARLELDYARDPLVVELRSPSGSQTVSVIRDQLVGHVVGSLGLASRVVLTLGLPVSLLMSGDDSPVASLRAADGTALGDLHLGARVRIVGDEQDAFALGAAASVSFPTARAADDAQSYAGTPGWSGRIRLLAEGRWKQRLRVSADLGVQLRDGGAIALSTLSHGLLYGIDIAVPIVRADDAERLVAHLDVRGQVVDFSHFQYTEGHAIELAIGAKYHHASGVRVGASVGPAFFNALGSPDVRAVLMVGYESPRSAPAEIAPMQPVEDPLPEPEPARPVDDRNRDSDDDGVVDRVDRCPAQAGPPENRGCPDVDTDRDGIVDRLDNCPTERGSEENHGCRDRQLVHITNERIEISERVYFDTDRASIRAQSFALLENIVRVMQTHPDIALRVEGHTDSRGDDQRNLTLSQERADAVVRFLVEHGIEARRLQAIGYGEEWPIVRDATTEEQHGRNRRVEFNIVREQDLESSP